MGREGMGSKVKGRGERREREGGGRRRERRKEREEGKEGREERVGQRGEEEEEEERGEERRRFLHFGKRNSFIRHPPPLLTLSQERGKQGIEGVGKRRSGEKGEGRGGKGRGRERRRGEGGREGRGERREEERKGEELLPRNFTQTSQHPLEEVREDGREGEGFVERERGEGRGEERVVGKSLLKLVTPLSHTPNCPFHSLFQHLHPLPTLVLSYPQ